MFDPTEGAFLTQDPTAFGGGDYNLYRYCGGDPATDYDPTGLDGQQAQDAGNAQEAYGRMMQQLQIVEDAKKNAPPPPVESLAIPSDANVVQNLGQAERARDQLWRMHYYWHWGIGKFGEGRCHLTSDDASAAEDLLYQRYEEYANRVTELALNQASPRLQL